MLLVLALLSVPVLAQERAVTGTVKESDGTPLPGVTVQIKGTTRGTNTDGTGVYRINVPENATLIFSFIGKTNQEVAVGNQNTVDVILADDSKSLQEVVVIGYGTQRRQDLTGSIASVSAEDFQKGNIVNPEQLVAGKIAGVNITPSSGQPGGGSQIRIRGGSSLNASNDPLIVLDGVPLDNSGITGASNALSFINPQDIETFTVLKDASAAAIYGSRAANGVILITTKKGRSGDKLRVSFSTLGSVSTPIKYLPVLSGDEFRTLVNERGNATQRALLGTANTDWQQLIYRNAFSTDNNLSVTGTALNIPYRVSVGYLNQQGILKTSEFGRTSASIGLTPRFFDNNLRVDLNLKGTIIRNRFADQGAIGAAVAFDPTQPVYSNTELYGGFYESIDPATNAPRTLAVRNPLGLLEQREDRSTARRSIGNLQLDYRLPFLTDLRANLNLAYDISDSDGTIFVPREAASNFNRQGINNIYSQKRYNTTLESYLNYVKDLTGINSRIDITAGYSEQYFRREQPTYPDVNVIGTVINPAGTPSDPKNRLRSYFGRVNYSLRNRYLLTATLRADGSSRFSPENRWGIFPSAAIAWNIKEEPFLANARTLSALKLRLGYGVTGQQDVLNDYPYLARYTFSDPTAQYQLGNTFIQTLRPEGYDRDIRWEETATYNAAVDYAFLEGRISGTIELYQKNTSNLLSVIPVPAGSNLTNQILTNVGSLRNRGIEFAINTTPVRGEGINWDLGFNVTYNQNEITRLAKVPNPNDQGVLVGGIAGGVGNTIQIHTVGYPTFSYYVYRQVYNENGRPIEGLYEDRNADGRITPDDRYRYKFPAPLVFLGLSSQLTYRDFNVGFTMRGNFGNYVYNNVLSSRTSYANFTSSQGFLANVVPGIYNTAFANPQYFSDYYLENASFVRMDNINLGYNVGRIINNRANLRLTGNIQNAFVITKYTGLDPEVAGGIDNNIYPRPRIFALGLNLDF
ncbi:TonB-dependent receptor [Nibrella saemangeumensis]|uniref:TonB-dependent receptor n=2 Tax=Nibrella saemangeumensis TaxID=1084526 RepID=A0ABP8NIZ4_9BACT